MPESFMRGTAPLWIVVALACAISAARPLPVAAGARRRLVPRAATVLALQLLHFAEEFRAGFHIAWPRVLGIEPWDATLFVAFNLGWLAIWLGSIIALPHNVRWAEWPLWFLAGAAVLNGLAHPLLAVLEGAYFPGLVSAPLLAIAGVALLSALLRAAAGATAPRQR